MVKIENTKCAEKKNLLKEIWECWSIDNPVKQHQPEKMTDNSTLGWNLYAPFHKVKDWAKRYHFVHFIFKYKVVVPCLLIVGRLLDKYLDCDVPEAVYNQNAQAFHRAFDRSLIMWSTRILRDGEKDSKVHEEQVQYAKYGSGGARALRTIKNAWLTLYLNDSIYREFGNIFLFELTKEMNQVYKDKKCVDHLFYMSPAIDDVHYFKMQLEMSRLRPDQCAVHIVPVKMQVKKDGSKG